MIIRILSEGQYRLEGEALSELDRLDDKLLDALAAGNREEYDTNFREVLALIRGRGSRIPDTELVESDLILPAPDTTFEEARSLFADYPRHLS
ncbi:PspA-associated protein PspAA [Neomoorella carbonis]|uniref:PspA-associated protein PspAA n=1 Tax=Neomoorella carbonis TaxID=3062783 RepID=UPI003244F403